MKPLFTAVGTMDTDINALVPGKIVEIELPAGEAVSFPDAADFPEAGRFSIRIPADAIVMLRLTGGPGAYQLDPGHWDLAFEEPGDASLTSETTATISVMQHREG